MRRMLPALGTACALCVALWAPACNEDPSKPLGSGNVVIVDVDATDQPPTPPADDGPDDSPFAPVDSPYGTIADGFAPYAVCATCACSSSTYCFAGGRGYDAFSGTCASAPASGGHPAIGCMPIPSACANEPSCPCILGALSPVLPCYSVCSEQGLVVYCP
jgi:hypothetical protein